MRKYDGASHELAVRRTEFGLGTGSKQPVANTAPGKTRKQVFRLSLVSNSAPADGQAMPNLHAHATGADLAVGDPRRVVEVARLLDDQVILVRETPVLVEVANMVMPGIALLRASGRQPFAAVDVLICPSRVQSSRRIALGIENETDIQRALRL